MLDKVHKLFIDNYLQTFSIEEAAIKAGIKKEEALTAGIDMLNNEEIQKSLRKRALEFDRATSTLPLTKERYISVLTLQYEKANKFNKTKEAAEILGKIAEAQGINVKDIKVDPVQFIINNLDENRI